MTLHSGIFRKVGKSAEIKSITCIHISLWNQVFSLSTNLSANLLYFHAWGKNYICQVSFVTELKSNVRIKFVLILFMDISLWACLILRGDLQINSLKKFVSVLLTQQFETLKVLLSVNKMYLKTEFYFIIGISETPASSSHLADINSDGIMPYVTLY